MKIRVFFTTIAYVLCVSVYGQVETRFFDKTHKENLPQILSLKQSSKVITLPSFDIQKMLNEDKEMEGLDVPFRFGKGFDVELSLKDGVWENNENGRVWTLSFFSKDAFSINFIFKNFYLPRGAELYITNQNKNIIYGPVTNDILYNSSTFLTDIIPDSNVTILLYEPKEVIGKSKLSISRVVHGYKRVGVNMIGGLIGSSESCNNDIACFPQYDKEAKAVALVLLANGTEICSGSLIMTTDFSLKPYFLTAFHCIDTSGDGVISSTETINAENWLFKFNYRKIACESDNSTAISYTYNSATFKAASFNTDFALMEISHNLAQYPNRHTWLGWDRSGTTPSNGACIHHPRGDVMKISIEDDAFLSSSWNGNNNHWLVNFDDGVVEHGSSGSPIINKNSQIVGQLHGNQNYTTTKSYCSQPRAEYGKFGLSWIGNNTFSTQLSHWLDPAGTNKNTMIGSFQMNISGSDIVCGEEEYTISDLPAGAAVALNTSNSAGFSIQVSNNLSVVSYSDGLLTVQKVSTGVGYIFVYYKGHLLTTREVWVGVPIVNDVYFMGGNIYIETVEESTPDPRYFYIVINGRRYRLLGGVGTIPLTNGTYDVEAYTSNLCGESDHYFGQIVVYGSGLYSLGPISSDHQVTIETIDYSDSPQPLEAMQTMTSKQAAKDVVPYELKNAMTGEVSARGEMPAEGGMLDFSRVRSGLYVLTLSPAGREPETFKLSLK